MNTFDFVFIAMIVYRYIQIQLAEKKHESLTQIFVYVISSERAAAGAQIFDEGLTASYTETQPSVSGMPFCQSTKRLIERICFERVSRIIYKFYCPIIINISSKMTIRIQKSPKESN